jgi:hypothetical protein
MLELKEWAEIRENAGTKRAKEEIRKQPKIEYNNKKIREIRINVQYNLRYLEEKETYLRNLEANKAYYNLTN